MRDKIIVLSVFLMMFLLYAVVFRTKTVTYMGEDENWSVQINAKLVGLNGSNNVEVRYKGKKSVQIVDLNINPHFDVGYLPSNNNGNYYFECHDDCEYYEEDSKLLFFIVWKEKNKAAEKMDFIDLKKISK